MATGALPEEGERTPPTKGNNGTVITTSPIAMQDSQDTILHRNARVTPLTLKSVQGSWQRVSDGTKEWDVFDASGGASVCCIGRKDFRVMQAKWDNFASTGIDYVPSGSYRTDVSEAFAKFLITTTDNKMAKVVFYGSGSEANEAIKKAAIQYHTREKPNPEPKRNLFIARDRSYHGATMGALGLSGHKTRRELFEPSLSKDTAFISPCYAYRGMEQGMSTQEYVEQLAQELEDKILELNPQEVAGFFAEPVVGAALGCVPAVPGYLAAMKKVCHKYGVLFILDEVMCGMGRTGYTHAWQEEDVVPDIQAVGKGLAGGYAVMSAVLFGHNIVNAFLGGPGNGAFAHGHTFQNFAESCAAGLAVQRIIQSDGLLANIREKGEMLRQKLEEGLKDHRYVGDIRGKCGFRGIEFVSDKETKEPFDPSLNIAWRLHETGLTEKYGVFVYPASGTVNGTKGDHIIISPAFNITNADVDTIVKRVVKLVEDFFDRLDDSFVSQA